MDFDTFNKHFIQVFDKYAPIKQKTVRANNTPYMTRALRKAMIKRTELATNTSNTGKMKIMQSSENIGIMLTDYTRKKEEITSTTFKNRFRRYKKLLENSKATALR